MFVVDSSVAIKWFVPEPGSEDALALLKGDAILIAPDILLAEVANGLWRKVRKGELEAKDLKPAIASARTRVSRFDPISPLIDEACDLAAALDHSVYDCLFLALAAREGVSLVTADAKFVVKLGAAGIEGVLDPSGAI